MQRTLANFFKKSSCDVTVVTKETTSIQDTSLSKSNKKPKEIHVHQKIQERWFHMFDWFDTNDERNRLFCKTCRAANLNNKFASEGASMYLFLTSNLLIGKKKKKFFLSC